MTEYRIEHDTMGEIKVPADALWRAQTQRAVENFPISGTPIESAQIRALAQIKAACAKANAELGIIEQDMADAIVAAAEEVATGRHDDQFPIDVFQTGSGTSSNMNTNEVLASLATTSLGREVHPNDHVNASQSSNDVFPTSIHVAATASAMNELIPSLDHLAQSLEAKAKEFAEVVKSGRTHLMDATPVTLGQEFGGYAAQIRRGIERVEASLPRTAEVPLGGTAVGTGINTPVGFPQRVIELLAEGTGLPVTEAVDHFEAQGARDGLVEMSGQLRTIAVSLTKICNDLRWMGSGPRTGLAEIHLPDLQPGSSIMPGKVNPVLPEATLMVAAQVIGNDVTIATAGRVRRVRAQRHAAGHRPQPARVDAPARQRVAHPRRPLHRRHHRQRGALPRVRRVQPVRGHAAQPPHRLRERRRHRQEGGQGAQDHPRGRHRGGLCRAR